MSKTLNTRILQKYDTEANWKRVDTTTNKPLDEVFIPLDGELVIYAHDSENLNDRAKIGDGVTTLKNLPFVAKIKENTPVPYPTVKGTYTYDGSQKTVQWNNYDSSTVSMYGTSSATNAGTYEVQFKPKSGYCWEDGSTNIYSVSWTMDKGTPSFTLNTSSVSLTFGGLESVGIPITTNSTGAISSTSNNTNIATTYISGKMVYINVGQESGETFVTVSIAATTNYNGASITVPVTVEGVRVSGVLEQNSWETISNVAKQGLAQSYWYVGDTKSVYIKDWFSAYDGVNLLPSGTYYVYIIGFNHSPDYPNTIDFQFCKTWAMMASGTRSGAFKDNNYPGYQDTSISGYDFCPFYYMEEYDPSGSGDVDQFASRDIGSVENIFNNCLESTVGDNRSLYQCLPTELTNVMINFYTIHNQLEGGDHGAQNNLILSSNGYHFTFPATTEILGSYEFITLNSGTITVNPTPDTQQYPYYANGNGALKYDMSNSSAVTYWTRDEGWYSYSEYDGNDYTYLGTYSSGFPIAIDGYGQVCDAGYLAHFAIAPIFRVGQEGV